MNLYLTPLNPKINHYLRINLMNTSFLTSFNGIWNFQKSMESFTSRTQEIIIVILFPLFITLYLSTRLPSHHQTIYNNFNFIQVIIMKSLEFNLISKTEFFPSRKIVIFLLPIWTISLLCPPLIVNLL